MPKRIVLDVDDTFDACTAASNYACSTPFMTITASSRSSCLWRGAFRHALLRPGKRPGGYEIRAFLRASSAPSAPSGRGSRSCCAPILTTPARRSSTVPREPVDWVLGLAPNAALRRHVEALEKTTAERFTVAPARGKVRRFAQFHDAAGSWSRSSALSRGSRPAPREPILALSSPTWRAVAPSRSMKRLYCARGQAENHIKAWKNHLVADAPPAMRLRLNQFRLFLHAGAYWLLWSMRRLMPKGSAWRVMQFDTLRLRLIKIAAASSN